ncbi:DUF4173 domain-containing protein [Nocardia sp. 2]|uniref:DUF4173 domain-containing protein n=1 Tax=Nocardia acididurans TaxID=2802282 RepID=A0ABS1LZA9_9NOCA|nr:DUF4173 domain-containing protein [Nocardia acididurans]
MWWAVLTLALLSVGWFRAAPWLFAACAVGAAVAGSLAVVGRRSVYGMVFDVMAVPCAALMAVPWVYRGVERARARRSPSGAHRVWWSAAATLALLLVIVPLLAGADAVFARLVSGLVPRMDGASVWQWVFLFLMGGLGTAGALYLLAGPLRAAMEGDSGVARVISRRFTRPEWGLPVGALIVVFAAFVGTQLAVLFGGDEYVQRTAELTYAEYARGGFWQLSIVSLLTLGVIWIVWQGAAKESAPDRLWLRIALAAVTGLSLVIVVSAVGRMWLYQQAYGFTVLRLVVAVFELWIGFVYLLVAASLARLDRRWPARAALGAGLATLFVLAVLNPERLVAERNIDRWQSGKSLDTAYLSRLSADALPAVDTLPDPQRAQIAGPIRARLEPDPWQGWNLSRSSARR